MADLEPLNPAASTSVLAKRDWKRSPKARREKLKELYVKGLSPETIASIMGNVSAATIRRDMKRVLGELSKEVRGFDQKAAVGGFLMRFEYLFNRAMEEYHALPPPPKRVLKDGSLPKDKNAHGRQQWHKLAMSALEKGLDLQLQTGLIERAADRSVHDVFITETQQGKVDLRTAAPADLTAVIAQQLQRIQESPKIKRMLGTYLDGLGISSEVLQLPASEEEDAA